MLLWLAARCRPVFAAAGGFIVSVTIVCTTVFSIGHFGDPTLPIGDRILGAQASILVVALSAYVLAALFAERRDSVARLASSNMMLERERSNKLMNFLLLGEGVDLYAENLDDAEDLLLFQHWNTQHRARTGELNNRRLHRIG